MSGVPVFAPAALVAHGDIHVKVTVIGVETHHQRLGVFAADKTLFGIVKKGRADLEVHAFVVEGGDGVADDHVRELKDGLAHYIIGGLDLCSREESGYFSGSG